MKVIIFKFLPSCIWLLGLIVVYSLTGCRISRELLPTGEPRLTKAFRRLDLASHYHTGISVYDPRAKTWLLRYADQQRFTPASNTKILTLYAALQHIGESLDAAWYAIEGDSVVIWGGGDPGTCYPDIHARHPLVDFITQRPEHVLFSNAHFKTARLGAGWAWDDFSYPDQIERTAFPIYGNRIWISRVDKAISVIPRYLLPLLTVRQDTVDRAERTEWGDHFYYTYNPATRTDRREVPVTLFDNDIRMSWQEATQKDIAMIYRPMSGHNLKTIKGSPRDTLLMHMMQESDNFIAEQLLLNISMSQLDVMSEATLIDTLLQSTLKRVSGDIHWADGSGLSRYNLMTPRSAVWLLDQIYQKKGLDYVRAIFPAGGESGTISQWYKGPDKRPYVFAKTGTLRHVHSLSGYLITRKGRVLIFSWMHNQFGGDLKSIKESMQTFFLFLYEHY